MAWIESDARTSIKFSGFQCSDVLPNAESARRALAALKQEYPGEVFVCDAASNGYRDGLAVTWIPAWTVPLYVSYYINTHLVQNTFQWPDGGRAWELPY
jgi:hypothetical protein